MLLFKHSKERVFARTRSLLHVMSYVMFWNLLVLVQFSVRPSPMSGKRMSRTSRPGLGHKVFALFSFVFQAGSQTKISSGNAPGSPRHPSTRHQWPAYWIGVPHFPQPTEFTNSRDASLQYDVFAFCNLQCEWRDFKAFDGTKTSYFSARCASQKSTLNVWSRPSAIPDTQKWLCFSRKVCIHQFLFSN